MGRGFRAGGSVGGDPDHRGSWAGGHIGSARDLLLDAKDPVVVQFRVGLGVCCKSAFARKLRDAGWASGASKVDPAYQAERVLATCQGAGGLCARPTWQKGISEGHAPVTQPVRAVSDWARVDRGEAHWASKVGVAMVTFVAERVAAAGAPAGRGRAADASLAIAVAQGNSGGLGSTLCCGGAVDLRQGALSASGFGGLRHA